MEIQLWHNPRCSKSRSARELLASRGVEVEEVRYLEGVSADQVESVLDALGKEPWEVARMGESIAEELGLADEPHDRARWIRLLSEHPVLIERPIAVSGDGRAVVGRPPESVLDLL